jgi:hypothetical protein
MKRPCLWLSICLLLLLTLSGAGNAEIPNQIPAAEQGKSPIWVSAQDATTPDGRFKSELFNPVDELGVHQYLEAAKKARTTAGLSEKQSTAGCQSWIVFPESTGGEAPTLEGLLRDSTLAFLGTVEDQQQGFYHGHPNSLLQIRVEKILKAPEGYGDLSSVFATYPQVAMRVGREMICMRADRYPARPLTGKGILIFTSNIPDKEPLVVAPESDGIFFEDEQGNVVLPKRFGEVLDPPAWSSVVKQAESLTDTGAEAGGQQ